MMLSAGGYYASLDPHEIFPRVREAVDRALALDPDLPEAYVALAWLRFHYDWDWKAVDEALDRALALNPSAVDGLFLRGAREITRERYEEGLAWIRRALRVDPHASFLQTHLAQYTVYAGRPEEGERLAREAIRFSPSSPHGRFALGYALDLQGRLEEAADEFRKAAELSPDVALWPALQGLCLYRAGRKEEGLEMLDALAARAERTYVDGLLLSSRAIALGDVEGALERLEEAYEQRAFLLLWIRAIPRYGRLRSHPRFVALLRRIWPDETFEVIPARVPAR